MYSHWKDTILDRQPEMRFRTESSGRFQRFYPTLLLGAIVVAFMLVFWASYPHSLTPSVFQGTTKFKASERDLTNENFFGAKEKNSLERNVLRGYPKYDVQPLNDSSIYKQLTNRKVFEGNAMERGLVGAVYGAFEDNRPMYKCKNEATLNKDGICKNRMVDSTRRISVVIGLNIFQEQNKTVGNSKAYDGLKVTCEYGSKVSVEGKLRTYVTNSEKHQQAALVLCPLGEKERIPNEVSLYAHYPEKIILVTTPITKHPRKTRGNTVEACIAPLHGDISENLIEWIEYHRLKGVEHFHFYDENSHANTKHIVQYYARENPGLVTLHNWRDAINGQSHYYYGQHIFIQHCLYANKAHSKYLMFFDADEFMKISRGDNVNDLVDYLESVYSIDYNGLPADSPIDKKEVKREHVAGFTFANWFFRNVCSPRPESKEVIDTKHPVNLVTQRVYWKTWIPATWNWKLLGNTQEALMLGFDSVKYNMNDESVTGTIKLDLSEANLNHYRQSDKFDAGKPCHEKRNYIKDYHMVHVKNKLVANVVRTSQDVWGV